MRARTGGGWELPARRNDSPDRRHRPRSRRPSDTDPRWDSGGHRRGASRPRAGRRPRGPAQVLGSVERARRLGIELRLLICGLVELRLEAVEPLLCVGVLAVRAREVGADEVEVVLELAEVLLERRAVAHDLLCALLDLHAL